MDTYVKSKKMRRTVALLLVLSSIVMCAGCSKKARKITKKEFKEYCKENNYYHSTGVDDCFNLSSRDYPSFKDGMTAVDVNSDSNAKYKIQFGYREFKNKDDAEKTLNMIVDRDLAELSYHVDEYDGGIKTSGEKTVCDVVVKNSREENRVYYVIVLVDDTLIYAAVNDNKNATDKLVKTVDKIINDLCY